MGLLDVLRQRQEPTQREGITDNPLRRAVGNLLETLGSDTSPIPAGVSGLLPLPILMSSAQAMLARTPDAALEKGVLLVRGVVNQLAALIPSNDTAD